MRLTDPLNNRQLAVLRWIADGCPAGEVRDSSYKRSARALDDRKLVVISRRGGVWTASLTARGQHYLDHGEHPPSQQDSRRLQPRRTPAAGSAGSGDGPAEAACGIDGDSRGTTRLAPLSRSPRRSPTEQLIVDVAAAGGRLELEPDRCGELHYKPSELVRNANRFGKPPSGTRLRLDRIQHAGDDWLSPHRYVVVLEDGPAGADAELQPVPVPDEVRRYHPAVSVLRKTRKLAPGAVNTAGGGSCTGWPSRPGDGATPCRCTSRGLSGIIGAGRKSGICS